MGNHHPVFSQLGNRNPSTRTLHVLRKSRVCRLASRQAQGRGSGYVHLVRSNLRLATSSTPIGSRPIVTSPILSSTLRGEGSVDWAHSSEEEGSSEEAAYQEPTEADSG